MRRLLIPSLLLLGSIPFAGILPPNSPIPGTGEAGAPHRPLDAAEQARFLRGRALFDQDFGHDAGIGPFLNGDSCRACHQHPVLGGAGGIDVNVQRPAVSDGQGGFVAPASTGVLAQTHQRVGMDREEIPADVAFVEERNSPSLLGLGLIESISEATILSHEDPADGDGDGIRGVAHVLADNSIGRFGWKASIPTIASFTRDALSNEMGITVPDTGNAFGDLADTDGIADPEATQADIDDLTFFVQLLDFAPKGLEDAQTALGEARFLAIGCAKCHVPVMDGVELYSDLLLHNVHPAGFQGVTDGMATAGVFRTSPLRGLRDSAPYFHDGRSETIDEAIRRHDGEALGVRQAFEALATADRDAILAFLRSR